uniref:Uncharacterized protein n=1 Tax=Rhizophora mucronata TaxID=61149 RepID=A0A2P2M8E9_RHIMU
MKKKAICKKEKNHETRIKKHHAYGCLFMPTFLGIAKLDSKWGSNKIYIPTNQVYPIRCEA